jgi:FMN phosphatase YigB (HAD superfamily)
MYKNYLFDLDGTLLPMDLREFTEIYLQAFCRRFVPEIGIDAKTLVKAVWSGAEAMSKNDGSCLNSVVFWKAMNSVCSRDMRVYSEVFDDFYRNEFIAAKQATGFTPYAKKTIDFLKGKNARLFVATNPLFPKAATYRRIEWAGLDPNDFEYITVYDNSSRCKPNLNYFADICSVCSVAPEESLMVGNDVDEDMCASRLGFNTYLITDCVMNRRDKDISVYKNGSFKDFYEYLINI